MKAVRFARLGIWLLMACLAAGCTTYYRVTDQLSGRTYYTTDIDRTDSGAVRFMDARTRSTVTLQSSEIVEISENTFESAVNR